MKLFEYKDAGFYITIDLKRFDENIEQLHIAQAIPLRHSRDIYPHFIEFLLAKALFEISE